MSSYLNLAPPLGKSSGNTVDVPKRFKSSNRFETEKLNLGPSSSKLPSWGDIDDEERAKSKKSKKFTSPFVDDEFGSDSEHGSDSEFEEELQVSCDEEEDDDDVTMEEKEQDKDDEEEAQDDDDDDDNNKENKKKPSALVLHLSIGKKFVVASFDNASRSMAAAKTKEMWESLVGTQWQYDADVCSAALSRGLSPQELKGNAILKNAKFLCKAFESTRSTSQAQDLWKLIGAMKRKMTVAFSALDNRIPYSELPKELTKQSTLKKGLEQGLFGWERLPRKHKKNVELALCAKKKDTFGTMVNAVTDKAKLWTEWACKEPEVVLIDQARWQSNISPVARRRQWQSAPESIMSNRELMLETIKLDFVVIKFIHQSLAEDLDFLTDALEKNILGLAYLPQDSVTRFPEIISLDRINKYHAVEGQKDKKALRLLVPHQHWADRSFVIGWLTSGLDLHNGLPDKYIDDKELILLHARHFFKGEKLGHNHSDWTYPSHLFSDTLRRDKDFIRHLLRLAPAEPVMDLTKRVDLYNDFELQMVACAETRYFEPYHRYTHRYQAFITKLENQLEEYEGFFKGILCGTTEGSGSSLVLLNQGPDANIKKVIASFLDFPKGESLTMLFQACVNRNVGGFNPLLWDGDK